MPILLPRHIVPVDSKSDVPLFFLVGPILGGGDWQAQMVEQILGQNPKTYIACPCRWDEKHWLSGQFVHPYTPTKLRQLHWERYYIKQAGLQNGVHGCIIAWLPTENRLVPHPGPEPYAMNTRRELGKFAGLMEAGVRLRLVVGGDQDFPGLDPLFEELYLASDKKMKFHTNMDDAIAQAQEIARFGA